MLGRGYLWARNSTGVELLLVARVLYPVSFCTPFLDSLNKVLSVRVGVNHKIFGVAVYLAKPDAQSAGALEFVESHSLDRSA